jgi:hypothetical protein
MRSASRDPTTFSDTIRENKTFSQKYAGPSGFGTFLRGPVCPAERLVRRCRLALATDLKSRPAAAQRLRGCFVT